MFQFGTVEFGRRLNPLSELIQNLMSVVQLFHYQVTNYFLVLIVMGVVEATIFMSRPLTVKSGDLYHRWAQQLIHLPMKLVLRLLWMNRVYIFLRTAKVIVIRIYIMPSAETLLRMKNQSFKNQ